MIISIKSGASGGSSRGIIHYLAHSKFDQAQEGAEKRAFFNEIDNDLDVRQANQSLTVSGAKPEPEELLHLVVAPSKKEIESIGSEKAGQRKALTSIVRATIAELKKAVKARNLQWVAVTHFNTDHPHAHVALQKEFINDAGEAEILRINRQMLHYNERGENKEKNFRKGVLILAAEKKVGQITAEREKSSEKSVGFENEKAAPQTNDKNGHVKQISSGQTKKQEIFRERRILAEEMLVAAKIVRHTRNIENLIEHGDKKRFKINDETVGWSRHLSVFDVERKIEPVSSSSTQARDFEPHNAQKRAELISEIGQKERAKYLPMIEKLKMIRLHVLGFENRHLDKARGKYTQLHNHKLLIEKKYELSRENLPLPIFKADEIQQLQKEAINEQNSEKVLALENMRQVNASELNRPSRRERDVQELKAAKIVAGLRLEAAEKRLLGFVKNKDFAKVKIGNTIWSHHLLEQHELRIQPKNDFWSRFKTKTSVILFRSEKPETESQKLDYPALHKLVSEIHEITENDRRHEIKKQKEFNATLDRIFQAETNPHKANLTPIFSAYELAEVEDLARETEHENFYEKSLNWQENFLSVKLTENYGQPLQKNAPENSRQTHSAPTPLSEAQEIIGAYLFGRSEARFILAQAQATQAAENLARYQSHKSFIKHTVINPKTGGERKISLKDVEPEKHYYLLDRFLYSALESKQIKMERQILQQAVNNKEKELTGDLEKAQTRLSRLEKQKTSLLERYPSKPENEPIFTPKEIAALDLWKSKTVKQAESRRIEKIIHEAEKNDRVLRIHDLLQSTSKELAVLTPDLLNESPAKIFPVTERSEPEKTKVENHELANQNSTEKDIQANPLYARSKTLERETPIPREKIQTR